jgi:DeoR family transcriptional regulator, fructose operon transcriptional repressor
METQIEGAEIDMYAEERHQLMVKRARLAGRVDVAGLAEELDVTAETVRRDLTTLERHGLLRRVHGGAIPVERLRFEPGLSGRDTVMQAEKERIAKAALDELPEEGAVSSMRARRRDGWLRSSRPIGSSGL